MIFDVKSWCSPETKLLPALVTPVVYIVVINGICTRSSLFHPVRAFQVPVCQTRIIDLHAPNSKSANFSANTALWVRGIVTKIVPYYMKNVLQGSVEGRFTCPIYLKCMVCSDSGANSHRKGLTDRCDLDFWHQVCTPYSPVRDWLLEKQGTSE